MNHAHDFQANSEIIVHRGAAVGRVLLKDMFFKETAKNFEDASV